MKSNRKIEPKELLPDRHIELQMISFVENNAYFDFSGDQDGSRFNRFKRVFEYINANYNFDESREIKWWEWGTRSGFTTL